MNAKTYLQDYCNKTAPILKNFFLQKQKTSRSISPLAVQMMQTYYQFMGGKNIRGALTKLGYECLGGQNTKAILEASLIVEIIHSFLLMHDDVMDQDILRRDRSTIHVQYKNYHQKTYPKGDADNFGISMAIDLGDAGYAMANILLADASFSSEIKVKVLRKLNQQIFTTAFGQAIDISYENLEKITQEDVMRVHRYKTANYTITGPLQYGALFAQAKENEIEKIEKYGLPVGIAFQLRDDELGLFGEEKKLGKPVGSDIRENKNTLLKIKALEWATPKEKEFLISAYGNQDIGKKEVKKVQEITVKTGALSYSQKLSRQLVEKGKKYVSLITDKTQFQDLLRKMADLMIERDS